MATKSKMKRRKIHQQNIVQKRRAKYTKVLSKFRGDREWGDDGKEQFEAMCNELNRLNVKFLEQMLNDLKSTAKQGFNNPNKELIRRVELMVLERTILK